MLLRYILLLGVAAIATCATLKPTDIPKLFEEMEPRIKALEKTIKDYTDNNDPDVIEETFASLLRSVQKAVVITGKFARQNDELVPSVWNPIFQAYEKAALELAAPLSALRARVDDFDEYTREDIKQRVVLLGASIDSVIANLRRFAPEADKQAMDEIRSKMREVFDELKEDYRRESPA